MVRRLRGDGLVEGLDPGCQRSAPPRLDHRCGVAQRSRVAEGLNCASAGLGIRLDEFIVEDARSVTHRLLRGRLHDGRHPTASEGNND